MAKTFETNYGYDPIHVEIFKNPTPAEIKICKPHYEIGAILTEKDIYIWNRMKAYHVNVMRQMGLMNSLPIIIIPDLTNPNRVDVSITDASKHTTWYHNPKINKFIKNHPFFKNKKIDNISYWDEDIVGDWTQLKNSF